MSSYIVSNETINRILTGLTDVNRKHERWIISKKLQYDVLVDKDAARLGKEMLLLNVEAVNTRYGDNNNGTDELNNYQYQYELANKLQLYKSLKCWLYQCTEGDVDKSRMYEIFDQIKSSLADDIISDLPTYDKAHWG